MATLLRKMYEISDCYSTRTHIFMCEDLVNQLRNGRRKENNLSGHFAKSILYNQDAISQIEVAFVPEGRDAQKSGTNPVTQLMRKMESITVYMPDSCQYVFSYINREIPHLRANTADEQTQGQRAL